MSNPSIVASGSPIAAHIVDATAQYEQWLATFTPLVADDLAAKHEAMASAAFPFLRGTFYRWAQLWPATCPELADAPVVVAVGDLHVENFGTWRDAEGRLVWGINDFDEAYPLAYTNDLTRLATSALLAIDADRLKIDPKEACATILDGYAKGIDSGGKPFVIAADNHWFLPLIAAKSKSSDPAHFWKKLHDAATVKGFVPDAAATALKSKLPAGTTDVRVVPRCAGVGSLGKPRFVAIAQWLGGPLAREVKALAPSACVWANVPAAIAPNGPTDAVPPGQANYIPTLRQSLLQAGLRCPDPFFETFLHEGHGWVVRRLAPDSRKVELKTADDSPDEPRFLAAMGGETANVHLATPAARQGIRDDLKKRGDGWLLAAARAMAKATTDDFKQLKQSRKK